MQIAPEQRFKLFNDSRRDGIKFKRLVIARNLFGPVLRVRGEIVEGVVSLSDPTEQHSHHA